MLLIYLLVAVLLIMLNAFFVLAEFAAVKVRPTHECQIDIGVKKSPEGKFAAHAWIRHEGNVILGGEAEEYKLIASFPQAL